MTEMRDYVDYLYLHKSFYSNDSRALPFDHPSYNTQNSSNGSHSTL